jgi:DNA-binding NtrC family response regulator
MAPTGAVISRATRPQKGTFFLTSRNIYVVDDDQDVRSSISFMLGAAGMAARVFRDGEGFVEDVAELEPGCICSTSGMPAPTPSPPSPP